MNNSILDDLTDFEISSIPKYWRYVGIFRLVFFSFIAVRMLIAFNFTFPSILFQNSAQTLGGWIALGLLLLYFFYHFSKGILEIKLRPTYRPKFIQVVAIIFTIVYLAVLTYLSWHDHQNWSIYYAVIWFIVMGSYLFLLFFDIKSFRIKRNPTN